MITYARYFHSDTMNQFFSTTPSMTSRLTTWSVLLFSIHKLGFGSGVLFLPREFNEKTLISPSSHTKVSRVHRKRLRLQGSVWYRSSRCLLTRFILSLRTLASVPSQRQSINQDNRPLLSINHTATQQSVIHHSAKHGSCPWCFQMFSGHMRISRLREIGQLTVKMFSTKWANKATHG